VCTTNYRIRAYLMLIPIVVDICKRGLKKDMDTLRIEVGLFRWCRCRCCCCCLVSQLLLLLLLLLLLALLLPQ